MILYKTKDGAYRLYKDRKICYCRGFENTFESMKELVRAYTVNHHFLGDLMQSDEVLLEIARVDNLIELIDLFPEEFI